MLDLNLKKYCENNELVLIQCSLRVGENFWQKWYCDIRCRSRYADANSTSSMMQTSK